MDSTPTPTPDATPKRSAPRAVLVSAMALGLAAGGYGIASAASGGGAGTTPSSDAPATVQETAPSGDSWAPIQSETAPDGSGGNERRTGPNGEDCDPADRPGPSGGADGYGSSSSGSGATDTDTGLDSGFVQTPF